MNGFNLVAVLLVVVGVGTTSGDVQKRTRTIVEKTITGNYEMNLVLTASEVSQHAKVFFSGNQELSKRAYLAISADGFKVIRETDDDMVIWKEHNDIGRPPWKVKILKCTGKANTCRLQRNNQRGFQP